MINGSILIGADEVGGAETFHALEAASGARLEPAFAAAGPAEVERACALAADAFEAFAAVPPEQRAALLEAIADGVGALGDALIVRAMQETGLPRGRLEGERARTQGQLRFFAGIVRQGDWLDATLDPAQPQRQPAPRPDLRRLNLPLGPVAVFGASNFPLAFSVAGGDTASALAAGCPVIVKGHPAHPGTGELVARAVRAAVQASGLPPGVFSYLPGPSNALGGALVLDPRVKAVGFTGSRAGGLALVRLAAGRPEPIPVFAEMSSTNPVLLFPAALASRGPAVAEAFVQSLTLGAGQFCTNPGLVIGLASEALDRFVEAAATALAAGGAGATMLTPGIHAAYDRHVEALQRHPAVSLAARGQTGGGVYEAQGALFVTDAPAFLADPALGQEVFGPSAVVVRCRDFAEVEQVVQGLEGQLTATLILDAADEPQAGRLLPALTRKAGRILANGWPTGVEVAHAMVHGGPYPATSDGRTTSVGSLAIMRFLRPVCFQNLSAALLPPALADANPWRLTRRVDGERTAP